MVPHYQWITYKNIRWAFPNIIGAFFHIRLYVKNFEISMPSIDAGRRRRRRKNLIMLQIQFFPQQLN